MGLLHFHSVPHRENIYSGREEQTQGDGSVPEGSLGGHFGLGHDWVGEWDHFLKGNWGDQIWICVALSQCVFFNYTVESRGLQRLLKVEAPP